MRHVRPFVRQTRKARDQRQFDVEMLVVCHRQVLAHCILETDGQFGRQGVSARLHRRKHVGAIFGCKHNPLRRTSFVGQGHSRPAESSCRTDL